MNLLINKRVNIIYFVVSFLVVVMSYLVNINIREKLLIIALSESIFWLTVPILFFSIVTFLTRNSIFLIWKKVTNYFLIISIVIVLFTPTSSHGLDFFPLVKETATIVLSSIYSIISLILIIYKSLKNK